MLARITLALGFSALAPLAAAQSVAPDAPGPGFVEAWGGGRIIELLQPGAAIPCSLDTGCPIVANGTATVKTFFGVGAQIGPARTAIVETVNFALGVPNGTGSGQCYPAGGHVSLTPENAPDSTLVIDFQGTACQLGSDASTLLFSGPWATDSSSTGNFATAPGIGNIDLSTPIGGSSSPGSGPFLGFSLTGHLHIGE